MSRSVSRAGGRRPSADSPAKAVVRAVAALVLMVAVLVGTPWLLVRVGRLDALVTLDWAHVLTTPDTGVVLLGLLSVVGWLSWVVVAWTVVVEVVAVISAQRVQLPAPGAGWLRPIVGILVAAIVTLVVSSTVHSRSSGSTVPGSASASSSTSAAVQVAPSGTPTTTPAPTAATTSPTATSANHPSGAVTDRSGPSASASSTEQAGQASSEPSRAAERSAPDSSTAQQHTRPTSLYIVQSHDTLWDIAERLYDEPTKWRDLARHNSLSDPNDLPAGVALRVPGVSQSQVAQRTGQQVNLAHDQVLVRTGDTLASLAQTHLGHADYWPALQRANATLVVNPDSIQPGWTLELPARLTPSARSSAPVTPTTSRPNPEPTTRSVPGPTTSPKPATASSGTSKQSAASTHSPASTRSPASSKKSASTKVPATAKRPASDPRQTSEPTTASTQSPNSRRAPAASATASSPQPSSISGSAARAHLTQITDLDSSGLALAVLGGLTAAGSLGVGLGLAARRRSQLMSRRLGRRIPHPDAAAAEFAAALRRVGTPDSSSPTPHDAGDDDRLIEAAEHDQGSESMASRVTGQRSLLARSSTSVIIGESFDVIPTPIWVDLGVTDLCFLGDSELVRSAGSACALGLTSSPWSQGLSVLCVGSGWDWLLSLDCPGLEVYDQLDNGLQRLGHLVSERSAPQPRLRGLPEVEPAEGDRQARATESVEIDTVAIVDLSEVPPQEQELRRTELAALAARNQGVALIILTTTTTNAAPSCGEAVCRLIGDQRAVIQGDHSGVAGMEGDHTAVIDGDHTLASKPDSEQAVDPKPAGDPTAVEVSVSDYKVVAGPGGLNGVPFMPQLLSIPAKRAVVDLFSLSAIDLSSHTPDPAPWWAPENHRTPGMSRHHDIGWNQEPAVGASAGSRAHLYSVKTSGVSGRLELTRRPDTNSWEAPVRPFAEEAGVPEHPELLLLGPVELRGARGDVPTRAVKQCEEYCAWILLHPGRASQVMTNSLLVAEGTRRSNMSRLRTWLGKSPEGEDYLPDAYSGRIRLHPAITSDWEQLQLLIAAGVNRASNDALVAALELVRGAPLADAAPTQWHWAEELRIDMAGTIRDIGVVLTDRALAAGDIALARWAASRALAAAPVDELLLVARIRTEHMAGNSAEVQRLVLYLTRNARALGVDLADETVTLMQEVMEGRVRARRAL